MCAEVWRSPVKPWKTAGELVMTAKEPWMAAKQIRDDRKKARVTTWQTR